MIRLHPLQVHATSQTRVRKKTLAGQTKQIQNQTQTNNETV